MTDPDRSRATLSEVAARAGVSKATASKVLNGRPGVAEETRKLVREAIAELGYVPTTGPREIAGPQIIQAVFDTLLGMYPTYVLDGIVSGAEELGVQVVVGSL
jgi:LacI family transcriptional regulator